MCFLQYTLFRVHTTSDDEKSPWIKYIIVGLLQLNFGNEDRPNDLRNLDPWGAEVRFLEPAAYILCFFISWYYQQTGNINNSNTWLRSKGIGRRKQKDSFPHDQRFLGTLPIVTIKLRAQRNYTWSSPTVCVSSIAKITQDRITFFVPVCQNMNESIIQ